jgi:tetratricopeptide (TPR) repeat protein
LNIYRLFLLLMIPTLLMAHFDNNEDAISFLSRAKECEYYLGENELYLSNYKGETNIQNVYLNLFDSYFPKDKLDLCILLLHKAMYEEENYLDTFLENIHRRRGECYFKMNNFIETSFSFKKVLELHPNDDHAKEMLRTIDGLIHQSQVAA